MQHLASGLLGQLKEYDKEICYFKFYFKSNLNHLRNFYTFLHSKNGIY